MVALSYDRGHKRSAAGALSALAAAFSLAASPAAADGAVDMENLRGWRANAPALCVDGRAQGPSQETAARAAALFSILQQTETGRGVLADLTAQGAAVCFDDVSTGRLGYYLFDYRLLALASDFDARDTSQLLRTALTLLHEYRHMAQDRDGNYASTALSPREMIAMTKLIEADASAFMAGAAYELEAAGYDVRAALAGDFELAVYEAYAHEAGRGDDNVASGRAHRAAFDAWYGTRAAAAYYEAGTLGVYESLVERVGLSAQAYGFRSLNENNIDRLGMLPDGLNYLRRTGFDFRDPAYYDPIDPAHVRRLETLERNIRETETAAVPSAPQALPN